MQLSPIDGIELDGALVPGSYGRIRLLYTFVFRYRESFAVSKCNCDDFDITDSNNNRRGVLLRSVDQIYRRSFCP
jgi:hypothetical protein